MSKSLTQRLEDLENEIRILLTLQEIGNDGCTVLKGKSITRHVDGNIEQIEFEGSNCLAAKSICAVQASSPAICAESTDRNEKKTQSCIKPPKTARSTCICGTTTSEVQPDGDKSDGSKKSKKGAKGGKGKKGAGDKGVQCKEQEEKLRILQENFDALEAKLKLTEEEKLAAFTTNDALKKKNDELRVNMAANAREMESLKKDNGDILRRLELEERNRCALEEKEKANQLKGKRSLAQQMEKLEVHAKKSTRRFRKQSEELASAVKTRDDHIRRLSNTTDKLIDNITEKENERRRLEAAHTDTLQRFIEAQNANKKLLETNSSLLKNQKDLQEKLQSEKQNAQKLTKQINQYKLESNKFKEDMERLRARLKTALEGPKEARHVAKLEDRLRESREREEIWLNEAAVMEAKLKELEGQQSRASEAFDSQLEMLRTANIKLKNKYERALDQVEELKIENETRITEMKNDFEKMSSNFTKKLQHLQKEKKSLTADYEQLALASQRDREALQQLIARTKKQDEVILAQQESINNKDNKLANMLKEHNNLKEQIKLTEQKMNLGENGLEKQKVLISELNSQIENLKTQLQHEREESIRNDGTIDQHICKIEQLQLELTNTEEKLKKALEEWRIASEEAKKAMEQLHIISSKLQIYEAKSETMQKSLGEEQVKVSEGGDAESLSEKVITVSGQFERKIALMEQQKQLELDLVLKEKDQAVYAAKFSTQKLLETVTDFQKQVDVHKQIQLMLAKVLQEKEECIESIQTTCPPCPGNPNAVRKKSKGKGCRSNSCPYR